MADIVTNPIEITVNDTTSYTIVIRYGDGIMNAQSSFTDINGEFISGDRENPLNHSLGIGSQLRGKTITVNSQLSDDNPSSSFMSVLYIINEETIPRRKMKMGDAFYQFETDIIFI